MKATAQIFLSYAREDEEKVEKLYQKLSNAGFKPWMDKEDILAGEQWKSRIQQAIRHSDFFLACLSANSIDKRGWIQREIKQALDLWQEKLDSDIYLIPVRLEDCEATESLHDFQWVNLFEEDGWTRLVKAIQEGMERRGKAIKPIVPESTLFETYSAMRPVLDLQDAEWLGVMQKLAGLAQRDQRFQALFDLVRRVQTHLEDSASPEGRGFHKTESWARFVQSLEELSSFKSHPTVKTRHAEVIDKLVERLDRAAEWYRAREAWPECIVLCDAVIRLNSEYRAAVRRRQYAMSQAERLERLKASKYKAAINAEKAGRHDEVIDILEELNRIDSDYRDVKSLLIEIRRR